MQQVVATVKKVRFHNETTHWAVVECKNDFSGRFIAKGDIGYQQPGCEVVLMGNWKPSQYGGADELNVKQVKVNPPSTEEGILLFLTSGLIKGMTKPIAKRLVDKFGKETLDHLDADIHMIELIDGVGPKRFLQIRDSYQSTKDQQDKVFRLMTEYSFNFSEALSIVSAYPDNTLNLLLEAPYAMYRNIGSISFVRFDHVILSTGYQKECPLRIREIILHYMRKTQRQGHTQVSYPRLIKDVLSYSRIDRYIIDKEISHLLRKKRLFCVEKNTTVFYQLRWLYQCEKEIAIRLSKMMDTPPRKQIVFDVEHEGLAILKEKQSLAVMAPFKHKVSIIKGRPGTGKTTLLKTMLDLLDGQHVKVLCCAPTGKASQRLREVTNRHCDTVHRTLGATYENDEFEYDDATPLDCDILILDETSMLDSPLMRSLLRALPFHARIVFIGDPDQLPSVNVGAVFRDMIDARVIPIYELDQVLRMTSATGEIPTPLKVAESVLKGRFVIPENKEDFRFIHTANNHETYKAIHSVISEWKEQGISYNDVAVFSPVNDDPVGVRSLNIFLKKIYTGSEHEKLAPGDKVIQTENNYDLDVFNGDVGVVSKINEKAVGDDAYITVSMFGKSVSYAKSEASQLSLAYCITGHKSQGSEYPYTLIVIPEHYYALMDRYWLNTLVTRCQVHTTIIGSKAVVERTVHSTLSKERDTGLIVQLRYFTGNIKQG